MGIFITGVEMPTKENAVFLITPSGDVWMIGDMPNEDTHLVKAKAVPVPLHGRLIDESAIELSKYEKAAHDALHNGKESILYDSGVLAGARAITRLVRNAPTIIPAEEGE